jgi:outer membrane receptor protein involved in Fe transport
MTIILALALFLQAADRQVVITVRDTQGLAVHGARITLTEQQGSTRKTVVSSTDGARIEGLGPGVYDVRIEASGFAVKTVSADLRSQPSATLNVDLELARLTEERVEVVTRTEQLVGDVPASVSVVRAEVFQQSPAIAADDVLRQVPTFSLFRRTSSLAAHPTNQGVSLRGVGPSGAGRTLVLIDNVPFNDPFGGWVYWTRIPVASVERVEMVEGANSSVYGNYALGGVINIVTTPPEGRTFTLRTSIAGRTTHKVDVFGASAWDKFGIAAEGSVFDTNGYWVVPETEGGFPLRGIIDSRATVDYENFNLKTDFTPTDGITAFLRGGYFSEDRVNAKGPTTIGIAQPSENNHTIWKTVNGGVRIRFGDQSDLQARLWGNFETFHSNFHALPFAPDRNSSRLTVLQRVPTNDTGGMAQWSRALGSRNYFTIGTDWRWVDGDSNETVMNSPGSTAPMTYRVSGGTQQSVGVFIQDLISITSRFQLTLSGRLDHWKNYDSHNLQTSATTGQPLATNRPSCNDEPNNPNCLADKDNTIGSPRIGAVYHVNDTVSVWGSVSWGFRAPTLNELYRQFAVGTVTTLANDQLGPERLVGGEGGVTVSPHRNLTWRSTWFVNKFTNPISNVTIVKTPTATTRQRQNLGKAKIWGLQSDVEYRFANYWHVAMAYLYDVAKVTEARADAEGNSLVGKYLAEVPMHRGSVELAYSNPKFVTASASLQITGGQYDDDLNTLWLPYYNTVDINVSRNLTRGLQAFFGVQNLFDRVFYVQRNPTTNGAPLLVTGGLEWKWNGR